MKYIPRIGSMLTIVLPGEATRGEVVRVVNDNRVIVEIGQPMTRNHSWRKGDLVPCVRRSAPLGGVMGEIWEAVEDRVVVADPPKEITPKPRAKAVKPAQKPVRKAASKSPPKKAAKRVR